MLKNFFVKAVLVALVIFGGQINFCNAAMPYSEMYLGGFTVGSSYSDITRMYGAPSSNDAGIENNATCHYGNSVTINYNNFNNKIQGIEVTANNGWKTPSGLAVGMNISDALDMYGEPDYKISSSLKTVYCYFHRKQNDYLNFGFIILFNNSSGKILQLGLYGDNTMASFEEYYRDMIARMVE